MNTTENMQNIDIINCINKHFYYMGKKEIKIASHIITRKPENPKEKAFIKDVKKALKVVSPGYRISTLEPSVENRSPLRERIYFKQGHNVNNSFSNYVWEEMAKAFAPKWNSNLATWYEWILFLAYRIEIKALTLEFVCEHSFDHKKTSEYYETLAPSGAREVGGFYDGLNNTRKITKLNKKYVISGLCFYEKHTDRTISSNDIQNDFDRQANAVPVIVLREQLSANSIQKETNSPKNTKIIAAQNILDNLQKISKITDFGDNNKNITSIVDKLHEIMESLHSDILRYDSFAYLFEIYLPEFYNLLNYYADLQKMGTLTQEDKDYLTIGVKKFYDLLYNQKLENGLDVETRKIQYTASIKTFINMLNKEIH